MIVSTFPKLSQTFVLDQVRGLIERGHEVDIFSLAGPCPDGTPQHTDFDQLGLKQRTFAAIAKPRSKLRCLQLSGRLFCRQLVLDPLWLGRWLASCFRGKPAPLRYLDAIVPRLSQGNYDIVHCQFGTLGNKALALELTDAPFNRLVVTFRGHDISSELRRRGPRIYDRLLKRADLVMANCDFFAHRLLAMNCDPAKLHVHRSGIDCDRFSFRQPSPPQQRPVRLITVGRLVEKKGIIFALEAISGLLNQGKSLEYRIIGDGPEKERYLQFVRAHGLQDVVRFLGACPQASVTTHLRQSDLFIASNITSQKGDQDAPINTLKEAMATGLPVVATRHGGIPELVEDGVSGYLIPEGDSKAIQERIVWLLDHKELWCKLAESGRRRVEQEYDLEQWNDVLVQRYFEVLGQSLKSSRCDEQAKSHNRDCAA